MLLPKNRFQAVRIILFFLLVNLILLFVYKRPHTRTYKAKKIDLEKDWHEYEAVKEVLAREDPNKFYTLNVFNMNNTKKAQTEKLVFNRLEKVGSLSMASLIHDLSKINNFKVYITKESLITTPYDTAANITQVDGAVSYVKHMNWINFTKYDMPKPIYMNLIRHPIDRVISGYYYIRQPDVYAFYMKEHGWTMEHKEYFETSFEDCVRQGILQECNFDPQKIFTRNWRRLAFRFCGHLMACSVFNSRTASRIAMRNIEQEYAVVGSWEDTNITLTVLEYYIPRFFRGAFELYYSNLKKYHKNVSPPHKSKLDPDIEALLKTQFSFEIEVYHFAKQRLYAQYIALIKREIQIKTEHNF